jgi:hypothetical protein
MILRSIADPLGAEAVAPPIGWSRIGRSPRRRERRLAG